MKTRLLEALASAESRIRAAHIPDARAEAEFLVGGVLDIGRGRLAHSDRLLNPAEARLVERAVKMRLERLPLAYVLGNQPFLDLSLLVKPGVFIPRPETEQLAEHTLSLVLRGTGRTRGLRILDLCAGSGALGIWLSLRLPGADVAAVEKSEETLKVAKANARKNKAKVRFFLGDLFSPLRGEKPFDIMVSNPPYVPTARIATLAPEVRKEPKAALDGGKDGLDVIRRIVAGAPERLNKGGWLALEMDPAQTRPVAELMRGKGFTDVEIVKDFQARSRIVKGRRG